MKISRGLRNNNPLNIRRNNTLWRGLSPVQNDDDFFCFTARHWGYRAALMTLRNYRKRHKLNTLSEWIHRWAPPVENNTDAYVRFVSKKTGFPGDFVPDINDARQMCAIVSAMSHMENGVPAVAEEVEKGWSLL